MSKFTLMNKNKKIFDFEYEKTQLSLVQNFSWLDINKLNGFAEEAREILLSNKLLSKDRVEKITEQIKLRIEFVN